MKYQLRILVSLLMIALPGFASPAWANERAGVPVEVVAQPDLPMPQLLQLASSDINGFWERSFVQNRSLYRSPRLVPYVRPFMTPCGIATLNNAFYCPSSNSIYFDNNFLYSFYRNIGDYAAVIILAHEWGHLVQAQSGIPRGLNIQLELQADCFAGSYTRHAESAKELEPGDLEEAANGLFNSGDPRGMPWFSPQAHGSPRQRINAFLDGYHGKPCFGSQ